MEKIIYVNGGIVINTPFFKCVDAGAFFDSPPVGAEIIEPNTEDSNGYRFLEINDEHPQSIFNAYYAKYEFASYYIGAEFLYKSYDDVYADYMTRINNIKSVIALKSESLEQQLILNRLFYLSIVASLETYICDIVLTKITECKKTFGGYYRCFYKSLRKEKKKELSELENNGLDGKIEQIVIDNVLNQSYCSVSKIKKDFDYLFGIQIFDDQSIIENHFKVRHLLAHKNGRTKNGEYLNINSEALSKLINDSQLFVDQISRKINICE